MLAIVHGGHEAAIWRVIQILPSARSRQHQRCSEPASVRRVSLQDDGEIVRTRIGIGILVDRGRRVDVVHDEIELAVVVQIDVCGAVRVTRLRHPPRRAHVAEGQIAVVAKQKVGDAITAERAQLRAGRRLAVVAARRKNAGLIIEIVGRLGIAVRDEKVLATVVVEIGEQCAPTPFGGRGACQVRDFTEHQVAGRGHAVAELQRVGIVVVPKAAPALIVAPQIRQIPAHAFSLFRASRQHVHLHDVGPAVVVEIRDVDPHSGDAGVFQRDGRFVGERAVAVVDVEHVIGCHIVRDVDVRPTVAIDISDDHTQSVSDLAQDPGFARDIREAALAIVAVKGVPALRALAPHAEWVQVRLAAGKVFGRVVQQEQVEQPVPVVVEKDGVRRVRSIGDAVARGRLRERTLPIINEEIIGTVGALEARAGTGYGHVDVEVTVVIDIHHGSARAPTGGLHSRALGDVLELHVAFVQVQTARHHVAAEEQVGEAVIVDVAHRDARAVVDVDVFLDVERISGGDRVFKGDAGLMR